MNDFLPCGMNLPCTPTGTGFNLKEVAAMNSNSDPFKTAVNKELSPFQFLLVIMMGLVLISCGDSSGPSYGNNNNNNDDSPGPNEVWMVGQSFNSSTLRVQTGAVVTWTNKSEMVHTVTSGSPGNADGMFDSGDIAPDRTFTYTFNETGTYEYFCIPHQPSMTGRVIVSEDNEGY